MKISTAENIHLFWEIFGAPLLITLAVLLAAFCLSAWVDYQNAKDGTYR